MTQSSDNELFAYLNAALVAAHKSGEILLRYFGKIDSYSEKSHPGDLVTIADKESENVILEKLQKTFPSHSFLAEESGNSQSSNCDFLWAIDPLDGTTNYTHQFPFFAVSIALLYRDTPIIGVIYNPILKECFHAIKGKGSFLNQKPIRVSRVEKLQNSLLATGFAYDRKDTSDNNFKEFCHITNLTHGVRRIGAASLDLAYVACGRLDGFWEKGLKTWDMAAGALMVTEAGGKVSDYDLSPLDLQSGRILSTNGLLQKELSREIMLIKQDQF